MINIIEQSDLAPIEQRLADLEARVATLEAVPPPPPPAGGIYDVGPSHSYQTIGDVPWLSLVAGDEVRIHYRVEPYREFIAVAARGTEAARITIRGIPGPNGEKPIISGQNAVAAAQLSTFPQYTTFQPLALVLVHNGYGATVPGFVTIDGLIIEGATADQADATFTKPDGTAGTWSSSATGVYLSTFEGVEVKNCEIRNCGTGIFTADVRPCTDLLMDGNYIHDCGKVGSYLQHCVYIQCVRPIYRNNRIGPTRAGSQAEAIKDRSADVLIEGNRIVGGSRQIDLSVWQGEIADRQAAPNANRAIIRNNTILNGAGHGHVGYVEGARGTPITVEFSHNTVVIRRDQSEVYYRRLWWIEYAAGAPSIAADGNLFDVAGATGTATELRPMDAYGSLLWGANWARNAPATPPASVAVTGSPPLAAGVSPGYVDEVNGDYMLAAGAPASGYGVQ